MVRCNVKLKPVKIIGFSCQSRGNLGSTTTEKPKLILLLHSWAALQSSSSCSVWAWQREWRGWLHPWAFPRWAVPGPSELECSEAKSCRCTRVRCKVQRRHALTREFRSWEAICYLKKGDKLSMYTWTKGWWRCVHTFGPVWIRNYLLIVSRTYNNFLLCPVLNLINSCGIVDHIFFCILCQLCVYKAMF